MEANYLLIFSGILAAVILVTYFFTRWKANSQLAEYKSLSEAVSLTKKNLEGAEADLSKSREVFSKIFEDTSELRELKKNADNIAVELKSNTESLQEVSDKFGAASAELISKTDELHELMSKLDLYSRLDEFAEYGHFEIPEYLHETSARFAEEIKRVRETQKALIKDRNAITYPTSLSLAVDSTQDKKILDGQVKLMLSAFNIETDLLIGKVSPSNYPRTLDRIVKLANALEKSAATLFCGFNQQYVEYKFQECELQYQFKLKRQEEQDEQRLIREQIREEQKAIKDYERAMAEAEKEERMYREMLDRAREQLKQASEEDRLVAEQRIADLERQLAEAEAKEERAKSMAEQTRRGHVYVISNIGSFGEDVFKIGLTRRLEPLDRVKELGDASVPFPFDVHAMIYIDDAPALETALHREFSTVRVNAVNLRKEFFRTDLQTIKEAVEEIAGMEAEFKMTILAEQYYETRRLQGMEVSAA
jgi:predicted  nucleic acid-binding Zn-ribbon protein